MTFVCRMGSFLLRMMYARTVESYAVKRNEFGFVDLARSEMDSGSTRLVAILGRAPGGPAGRWDRIRAPKFARILIPATENVPGSARIGAKIHGSQRGSERANSPKTPSKHRAKTPWTMEWVLFMTKTMTTTCPVLALPVL